MSIPKDLRNVKETESTNKFECIELCIQLVRRAVESTQSDKVQSSSFAFLADMIIESSLEIYKLVFYANSIPYSKGQITEENWRERRDCQIEAMRLCTNLEGLIMLARRCFRWRNKKEHSWVCLILKTREYISKWHLYCKSLYDNMLVG